MKKQKSGISLIVLVITIIVIIILAAAVILSIANNNPIENAKEARIKNDLKAIEEELTLKQASSYVDEHANNKTTGKITIDDLESAANYKDKLGITEDGKLFVTGNASDEERKVAKNLGIETKDPITFEKKGTGELGLGSEVTANGESFYVIGGDETGEAITSDTKNVILLAKYNLKKENNKITLKQDPNGGLNGSTFSSTNYWSNETTIYPLNLNNCAVLEGTTSIITKAKEYGKTFETDGRLITIEEIKKLGGNVSSNSSSGCPKYINSQAYWIGSAENDFNVWFVYGEYGDLNPGIYEGGDYRGSTSFNSPSIFN